MKPALLRRRLDLPGLGRARRESRRRAKLCVKRPLHIRAGRLLNLCHRHRPPSPAVARIRESRAEENQFSPVATSGVDFGYPQCPDCHSDAAFEASGDAGGPKTRSGRSDDEISPGQKRPAGELDGSPLLRDGIDVRSCEGAARKDGGLCRNGFCGLKDMMTNAPINVAMPVAIRAKKNLVIYSGGLNPLFSQALMSDLIGCSANTF
jgi:hypothetical protein